MKKREFIAFIMSSVALAACGDDSTMAPADMSGVDQPPPQGGFQMTVSGEELASTGFAFPPAGPDDPAFVDGWEVKVTSALVVFDHVRLSDNPDKSAADQSQTDGVVAQLDGPWVAQLSASGGIDGKGGAAERAFPFGTLANQNKNGNAPFDPTKRYAFSFDVVAATASATKINLTAADAADYEEMISKGWTVLYQGTATWKGTSCTTTNAAYDFASFPKQVKFKFGLKTPTNALNCQNPDNDPAAGLGGEEHQRGVQAKQGQTTIAQVTFHLDHPFWESLVEDAPMKFDQFAALAKMVGGAYVVTQDDLVGVNYTAIKDGSGNAVPWRSCVADYTPPNANPGMGLDSGAVPYNPTGTATQGLRDLLDYFAYNQTTQTHLNADGLCYTKRNYPAP